MIDDLEKLKADMERQVRTKIVFQLHSGGQPIAKQHSTFEPCVVEAAERKLLVRASGHGISLADGCEIKELEVPREYNHGCGHSFQERFRHHALSYANYHPDSTERASQALSGVRGPLSPDIAARAAFLAERAVKLAEGMAALVNKQPV